jgi:cytochrome c1
MKMTRPTGAVLAAAGLACSLVGSASLAQETPKPAVHSHAEPEIAAQNWSFNGPFGTFDRAQLQRGYKVYREVCATCHSMRLLSYRNLGEPSGPGFSAAAVEVLAGQAEVTDGPNDKGEMFKRPARPSDRFRSPFPNEPAARAANNGALPPDLSVMAKARPGGPDYIHALLTGYREPPADFQLAESMHYNAAFSGNQIAMPPPLSDSLVTYTDGTKPTVDNYAKDVAAYLMWTAEPKLEERHKLGLRVMIFLVVFAVIMYLAKRAVWARVHGGHAVS